MFQPLTILLPHSLHIMLDPTLSKMVEVPSLLLNVFTDAFHNNLGPGEAWQEAWLDFQFGLLHMLGAMLSSSNVRTCIVVGDSVHVFIN